MPSRVALIYPSADPSHPYVPTDAAPADSIHAQELVRAVSTHAPDGTELLTVLFDDEDPDALAPAIDRALTQGVQVIVVPMAGDSTPALQESVASAQAAGAFLVAPALKQGQFFPGDYDGVFGVVPQGGLTPSTLFWVDPENPQDEDLARFAGCFVTAARFPDGHTNMEVVPYGLLAGWIAQALADGATSRDEVQAALEATALASQTNVAEPELPFPELAQLPFPAQVQLAFTWGARATQWVLGDPATDPGLVEQLSALQVRSLSGDPSEWFVQAPQLLMPHAPGLGEMLMVLHGMVGQQHPEGLPRMALVLQGMLSHEAEMQRLQLKPPAEIHPQPWTARHVATWLRHMARFLDRPWDEATEAALREGQLPAAPAPVNDAFAMQLQSWLHLAHHIDRLQAPDQAAVSWSVLGGVMTSACERSQLLGENAFFDREDPEHVAFLPEAHRQRLRDAGDGVHRRQMHWHIIDPVLDAWAQRCLRGLADHADVAEVLATWDVGGANRMASRFPSMDPLVEPVAVPWVRAERALLPLRDTSPEAAIAWFAMRQLVSGGLHGDDDSRWMGQVYEAASILDPDPTDRSYAELMDALGVD